ncbi:hypothetical protein FE257_007669 [Aspergillus nanangensis]|uniref:Uncharacterized protein n=1 Tax=Aspergillus nanangensis TaxID=2582783 RepID=A0AAD4GU11_ASPNN|nr:hypothetical protein FE257_007669 [Aspergillus nanangensis]
MSQPPSKKLKSDSNDYILGASQGDIPEVEHVETASSTVELPYGSGGQGQNIERNQTPSTASASTRSIASARAALNQLTKKPQPSHPDATSHGPSSQSSRRPPTYPLPVKTAGQLGVQNFVNSFRRGVKSSHAPLPSTGRQGQQQQRDCIGYSYLSKPPRWLIMPVTQPDAAGPDQRLQWIFDPGPPTSWPDVTTPKLYKIGYKQLRDAYCDPEFRDNIRTEIRMGPFALNVSGVEDPLPLLPPQPRDFANTRPLADRWPHSKLAEHSEKYHYRDYKRPSLASRPYPEPHASPFHPTHDRPRAGSSDGSSESTLDGSKLTGGRYSGSSDLERQRTRVPYRVALDEVVDDAQMTPMGLDVDHPVILNELGTSAMFNLGYPPGHIPQYNTQPAPSAFSPNNLTVAPGLSLLRPAVTQQPQEAPPGIAAEYPNQGIGFSAQSTELPLSQ